jgi:hypothetical protein
MVAWRDTDDDVDEWTTTNGGDRRRWKHLGSIGEIAIVILLVVITVVSFYGVFAH